MQEKTSFEEREMERRNTDERSTFIKTMLGQWNVPKKKRLENI